MQLSPETRLGPYQILALIGAGGMGEVYKAKDTRLDRIVAIKVLSEPSQIDSEPRRRFEREARAISSLNHPNICTLHDVGREHGRDYLVMEFVEGETIASRLQTGALPVREALQIALQVADALHLAHRTGIIHRDLKPGNIMLASTGVKVLDFGLARFSPAAASTGSIEGDVETKTMTAPLTAEGMVVGTLQYMAPEQIKGREGDHRIDVFAFGLVLYEMLTGERAFRADSQAGMIAALLASEPESAEALRPEIPPALDHIVRTCLAKDPDDRFQSMRDVALQLNWVAQTVEKFRTSLPEGRPGFRKRAPWFAVGLLTLACTTLAVIQLRPQPSERSLMRFEEVVPPGVFMFGDMPSVSPDGRSFVYALGRQVPTPVLWLRRLEQVQPTKLPGTEEAYFPFWSPDNRSIGFFARGELKTTGLSGGTPQVICKLPAFSGGTWNRNGVILFGTPSGPIQRTSASGGSPRPVLPLDTARQERSQQWPQFLPDGRHFLYTSVSRSGSAGVYLGSLDSQETRLVLETPSNAVWVAPGLLLFARGRSLMAQPFDADRLRLSGEPIPVVDGVARMEQRAYFSSSLNGTLVYWPESAAAPAFQPTWYDRSGKRLGPVGNPRPYRQFVMSPDEKWLAAHLWNPRDPFSDIWLVNLASGIANRLTSGPFMKDTARWSPDGREVLFSSAKGGILSLYRKVVGSEKEQLVYAPPYAVYPGDWLRDGSFLFLTANGGIFGMLAPGPGKKAEQLLGGEFNKDGPQVSPDGRWVVYNTDESGLWEVYLASFPSFENKRQISSKGGAQGFWRRDGREVFYLSLDGELMSVSVQPGSPPEVGSPRVLFQTRVHVAAQMDQFAPTADGQKFLLLESSEYQARPFTVVVNWPEGLPKDALQ